MAEEIEGTEQSEQAPQAPHGESGQSDGQKPETDWKAEARKWEARAKENKGAAEELATLKESQMSALEKAQEKAAKAQAKADRLEAEKVRAEVVIAAAKEAEVDVELLSMMAGDTPDEIVANAQTLKDKISTLPVYPNVPDGGVGQAPAVTKEQIMKIKNPSERIEMISKHSELFK